MTPAERATNLIQRIERLFGRATPAPWEADLESDHGDYVIWGPEPGQFLANIGSDRIEPILSPKEASTAVVAFDLAAANAALIVTLRNVGLEGIVGPIRDSLNMLQEFEYLQRSYGEHSLWTTGAGYSLQPRYLEMKAGIEKWCDRWEPELDREESK